MALDSYIVGRIRIDVHDDGTLIVGMVDEVTGEWAFDDAASIDRVNIPDLKAALEVASKNPRCRLESPSTDT